MPIYEYRCHRCGDFEVMQRITEQPLARCPTCNGEVKRLISNTSFQLKGSGWYITDYARKQKPAKEGEKAPAEAKNGKSSAAEKTDKTSKSAPSEPAAD
jgi:putative FmdB family regulatory protein